MHPMPISSHRVSLPSGPNHHKFGAAALLRRFSTPSPYTGGSASRQPTAQPVIDPTALIHDQVLDASLSPASPAGTVHQYSLKSRGKNYALITIGSHARNAQDPPLLYFGEDIRGSLILSLTDLSDMQNMDVVLQVFDLDPIIPSFEAKRVLLSHQVDESHISGGQFCWPFTIAPPADSISPPSSSGHSSLGHQSSNGHGPVGDLKFQLIVTINRRGRLTRNIGVKQKIIYVPPPDPSLRSSPAPMSVDLPPDTPTTMTISWTPQKLPTVIVRGVMFGEVSVEVECKLIIPSEYPAGDSIPLRLALTCENYEAIGLLSVPHVIDVRLQKVMAFGDRAGAVRPLNLRDRGAFHRAELAADANWEVDGHVRELPMDEQHRRPRWRIKLKGALQKKPGVELNASYEEPGVSMAIMYFVGFFPFRATADFHPANKPNRELVIGKIKLT